MSGEFLMPTGCRPIEALRLSWADYTEVGGRRFVRINGKRRNNQPTPRTLEASGRLHELLQTVPRVGEAIFGVENGLAAGRRYAHWPEKRWAAVCQAAEVPTAPYDLRHTFITEQVTNGVPLWKVAKWCGNSVRVIETAYAHLQPGSLDAMAAFANEAVPSVGREVERPQRRPQILPGDRVLRLVANGGHEAELDDEAKRLQRTSSDEDG